MDLPTQIRAAGLPEPALELHFHPVRRWRWDLAWPDERVAVEIQGGTWSRGRHTRGRGYEEDCLKLAAGVLLGWRVLWVTTQMVADGRALALLEEILRPGPACARMLPECPPTDGSPPRRSRRNP